jgi:hypothetical protein
MKSLSSIALKTEISKFSTISFLESLL